MSGGARSIHDAAWTARSSGGSDLFENQALFHSRGYDAWVVRYDPEIIQKFADRLYEQARAVILRLGLLGVLLGIGVGALSKLEYGPILFGMLAGGIGALIGQAIGFHYKLKAQTALCQMMIEQNTRGLSSRISDIGEAPT